MPNFSKLKIIVLLIICYSCSEDAIINSIIEEDTSSTASITASTTSTIANTEVNSFIYEAMNTWYLYKDAQPLLADDYFESSEEKEAFLNQNLSPEDFFNLLKVDEDRFSDLADNINISSKILNNTHGFSYSLLQINSEIIGVVKQVYNESSAAKAGLARGDFFNKINGITLTSSNYQSLLTSTSYTLGRVYNKGTNGNYAFEDRDEITITVETINESPIVNASILNVNNTQVGYLFYKYFEKEYSNQLNEVFLNFKNNAVENFVLDLRYNSGGSEVALLELASMLTGQFTGEVFCEELYNQSIQGQIDNGDLSLETKNYFPNILQDGTSINSLQLSTLYVITSTATASSSELLIKCLEPYINVIVVGDEQGTVGKSVAVNILYDAPNYFSTENINTSHNYALQMVRKRVVNKEGEMYGDTGVSPDIIATESFFNLGTIGDFNEPLLHKALEAIVGEF